MYGKFIESLNHEEREAMGWYIAHIILADGKVVHSELESIKQVLEKIQIKDSKTAMDIYQRVKNNGPLRSLPNLSGSDHSTVMKIFLCLLHVAVCDYEFADQEADALLIIGSTIGFSEKTIEDLINHHKAILKIAATQFAERNPCSSV